MEKFKKGDKSMLKTVCRLTWVLAVPLALAVAATPASAEVDWTDVQAAKIDARPLDMVVSQDGKVVYLLTPGKILLYSVESNKVTDQVPVDGDFDRIAYSSATDALILTASSSGQVKLVRVAEVKQIDISGLPYKGPENAPVTMVVFDDYQ